MQCLHPFCPMGNGHTGWAEVVDEPYMRLTGKRRTNVLSALDAYFSAAPTGTPIKQPPPAAGETLGRLFELCPCLFTQIDERITASGVVHLCELTLGEPITSANAYQAYLVQHPKEGPPFKYPANRLSERGGDVMEMLCSEVLTNAGIPAMVARRGEWPVWRMPGHILMNNGNMQVLKALGDVLIPCAPTNLIVSVKTEAAKERLLYSANSIEGIGFGFFKHAKEFWTTSRMMLFKRMGFAAIYLPDHVCAAIWSKLATESREQYAVNINGTALYRPLSTFGDDMNKVVGKSSTLL